MKRTFAAACAVAGGRRRRPNPQCSRPDRLPPDGRRAQGRCLLPGVGRFAGPRHSLAGPGHRRRIHRRGIPARRARTGRRRRLLSDRALHPGDAEPARDSNFTVTAGGQTVKADKASLAVQEAAALDLTNAAAFKVSLSDPAAMDAPHPRSGSRQSADRRYSGRRRRRPGSGHGHAAGSGRGGQTPAVPAGHASAGVRTGGRPRLASARSRATASAGMPVLVVSDPAVRNALAAAKPGPIDATISAHIAAPARRSR